MDGKTAIKLIEQQLRDYVCEPNCKKCSYNGKCQRQEAIAVLSRMVKQEAKRQKETTNDGK